MNADLERLIALQKLDSSTHDAEHRLVDEPERLAALETRLETARQQVASAKQRLADNQNARRGVEKDVAVHQGRLSKFREQAMAVKTNQEYHAIQHEMAFAQAEIKTLEDKILELGPDQVIAFVAETVVGATLGAVPPVADYFKRIRAICDRYGVLLILDEVMCGMGRTGTLHACEQDGVAPDLMAIAKGLGGGYQPVGAVLLSKAIFDAFSKGSGFFQHGHTYMGHPMAAAAGLAVQDVIRRDGLLANVVAMGEHLQRRLQERFSNHHHVGDIRGRGLFRAIELVSDCDSKQPFAPELKLNARIKREAMARGLIVYPMGGTIDGVRGDHVLLAPPFIVNKGQIDAIVERLGDAVDAAVASVG